MIFSLGTDTIEYCLCWNISNDIYHNKVFFAILGFTLEILT